MSGEVWVLGDVHGQYEPAVALLRRAGFVDDALHWCGGARTLWFIGDLTDRGPHGVESIELCMRLQREAPALGGAVGCLIGNHEVFLLAAHRFGQKQMGDGDLTFAELWIMNGGKRRLNLTGLTEAHIRWMSTLPAVVRSGKHLLVHADSPFYLELGTSAEEVNASTHRLLADTNVEAWGALIKAFVRRNELWDDTPHGARSLERLLEVLGGEVVVHGHTPIPLITDTEAALAINPLVYSNGRCVNVDGGMFLGSPGIAYRLS